MKLFQNKNKGNVIVFRTSSILLRLANLLIAFFILGSNITGLESGSYSLIAIGIGCFCFLIASYQNSWFFCLEEKIVINKKGILVFNRNIKYAFSEISSILIEKYNRSGRKSEYTEISIHFKNEKSFIIESEKTKKIKQEIALAKELQEIIFSSS